MRIRAWIPDPDAVIIGHGIELNVSEQNNNKRCFPATPRLYIWYGELLFLGTFSVPHHTHRVVQEKLVVCLEGSLTLQPAGDQPIRSRSCLLRTGTVLGEAGLDVSQAVVALFHLPPFSQDYPALRRIMKPVAPGVHCDHPGEEALIRQLRTIRDGPGLPPNQVQEALQGLVVPSHLSTLVFRQFDPRILEVVQRIQASIGENLSLGELAAAVHLSDSRLAKLFKDQTGLPVTQYRLRYRVYISVILLALGHSVTEAALLAGFASSAHFSRSFSAINGLAPSTTFMKPPFLETFIDDAVLKMVRSITHRQPA